MFYDTHNQIVDFGTHKGERWTRIPVAYLRWLANVAFGRRRDMAESELKRRGTTIPSEVELSGHAIDRASMMDDNEWQEAGGVHSWLTVISNEASKLVVDDEVVLYKGYRFVFVIGNHYPVLKTIIDKRKKQKTK